MKKLISIILSILIVGMMIPIVSADGSPTPVLTQSEAEKLFHNATQFIYWIEDSFASEDFELLPIDGISKRAVNANESNSEIVISEVNYYGEINSSPNVRYMIIKDGRYDTVDELKAVAGKYFDSALAEKVLFDYADDDGGNISTVVEINGKAAVTVDLEGNFLYSGNEITGFQNDPVDPKLNVNLIYSYLDYESIVIPTSVSFVYTDEGWRVSSHSDYFKYLYNDLPTPTIKDFIDNPNTGDETAILIALLALSGLALACVPAVKRRER